jgi:hypothetical protein
MGHHRHCRVLINYNKICSTGGVSAEILREHCEEHPKNWEIPGWMKWYLKSWNNDEEPRIITFVFIKRHACRKYRTIERLVSYGIKNGRIHRILRKRIDIVEDKDSFFYKDFGNTMPFEDEEDDDMLEDCNPDLFSHVDDPTHLKLYGEV